MGVSLAWRPTNPKEGITFASGSDLFEKLRALYGDFPIILGEKEIPALSVLAQVGDDKLWRLVEAISEHGTVEVQARW